ncbi:MAG: type II toxin-antitoxin system VapC family toxin [Ardenticatenaceae bacterium]|nr:type II toxin-antitoxin system VapC family toxin [Ardenticatenaceae bacterium]
MIAIDTNIIIRFLTQDDPNQSQLAEAVFSPYNKIFLPLTVFLETEWVLRYAYRFESPQIVNALRGVCGLPNVTVEKANVVERALRWHENGVDLADAIHMASSLEENRNNMFVTFDKKLIKKGSTLKIDVKHPESIFK